MSQTPRQDSRPNLLVICTDQMRADHMALAGNPAIHTPNLDRLAGQGVYFPRSYVNCPLCMPSRSTMNTGLTPRGHGVRTNGIPLNPNLPTVAGALADAGYRTASVGKIHVTNYSGRSDVDPASMPASAYPELRDHWKSGAIEKGPSPYCGFEHVELTLGHGGGVGGDYDAWLEAKQPGANAIRYDSANYKRSPLGAENCSTFPLPEELHHTAYVAERTIDFLQQQQGADQPFYLWSSFPDPHHPYEPPAPWDTMYSPDDVVPPVSRDGELDDLAPFFQQIHDGKLQLSGRAAPTKMSEAHRREILAYTYGLVSLLDKYVGRIIDSLDELGLAENTALVFIADHGDLMGDHHLLNKGPFHFEGLLRVPMIWRFPSRFGVQQTPALASLLDLPPTLLDLAGVDIPAGPASHEAPMQPPAWPGRSLVPVLEGTQSTVQDSVIIENDEDYLGLRLRTLVTATHKITTYTGHRGAEPYGELFDLENDPGELHNRWNDPEAGELKRELIELLHYRLVETDTAVPRRLSHA